MRRLLGPLFLLVSILLAYQSYATAQRSPEVEALAWQAACDHVAACVAKRSALQEVQTSSFGHRYRFGVEGGAKWVSCKREWIAAGHWSCEPS